MASTEDRVRQLISENLEVDGEAVDGASIDFNGGLTTVGVSSMDVVSFGRVLQDEFGVELDPSKCAELPTLAQLVEYLDSAA